MVSIMTDTYNIWGRMEEEKEEDIQIARSEFIGSGSPNSRVRFSTNRTVVRYPSEKSLLLEETPTVITDEDDCVDQQESDSDEGKVDNEDEAVVEEPKLNNGTAPASTATATEASTNSSSNGDMKKDDSIESNTPANNSSRSWIQRAQIQRYTPRFTPPPQVQADNGEDESDQEEEVEEGEVDEEGYDSVVEESGGEEEEEDPIKKIAEESIVSTKQKLNEIKEKEKAQQVREQETLLSEKSERDKILQEVAQLKAQLRTEVEKVEQASKAASAAAAKAEEDSVALSSRVTSMRSLLAVLCGCGARIAGMLVATRLLDVTAANMQQPHRPILFPSLFLAFRHFLPISPHIAVATGVSISQALLYYFRPSSMKWWWLTGVNSTMGALVSVCAAAHGGARGTALGYALAAGCIIGLISSPPKTLPS